MHGSADGTPYSVRSVLNMNSFQCGHSPNSTVFGTTDDHPHGIYHVLGMTDGSVPKPGCRFCANAGTCLGFISLGSGN